MPLPTSEWRNPVCLEMKLIRSGRGLELGLGGGPTVMDIGSVDSSDTYASCNTQPFTSQVSQAGAGGGERSWGGGGRS